MSDFCKDSKFNNLSKKLDLIKNMKGAVIPSLQEAQAEYGYLCPELIELIATKLNISTEQVYGVASFYSQFKLQPIGKHRVSVCLGTACYVKGADEVLKKISEVLNINEGETTKDGYYSLDTVRCVGCCSLAPLIMIDEKLYAKVKVEEVEQILNNFKKENE
ncbi:MAG: NADH-quinone oxidoreductase subunit NuoE [Clostridiales bacterium]|nr:NADH-quinone oxidoreductase subunit NuoE [Clostridiales bacterium]